MRTQNQALSQGVAPGTGARGASHPALGDERESRGEMRPEPHFGLPLAIWDGDSKRLSRTLEKMVHLTQIK